MTLRIPHREGWPGLTGAWVGVGLCFLLACDSHGGELGIYQRAQVDTVFVSRDSGAGASAPAPMGGAWMLPNVPPLTSVNMNPETIHPPQPPPMGGASSEPVATYHRDVRPLMQRLCVPCHSADPETRSALPPLTTFDEVMQAPELVADAVEHKRMPPFDTNETCRQLSDSRAPTIAERAVFSDWRQSGFPEGAELDFIEPSHGLGAPSHTLQTSFRFGQSALGVVCYALDEPLPADTYITAFNLTTVLPVTSFTLIALPRTSTATDVDCSAWAGNVLFRRAADGRPLRYPMGSATRLAAGQRLVVRAAFDPALSGTVDALGPQPSLELWTLPPGELPSTLVSRLRASTAVDIAPGATDSGASDIYPLPAQAEIFAIDPGTGIFATSVEVALHRQMGFDNECVLSLPIWHFKHQEEYRFAEPIHAEAGDTLAFACRYDNSSANQPVVDGVQRAPGRLRTGLSWLSDRCELDIWQLTPYP